VEEGVVEERIVEKPRTEEARPEERVVVKRIRREVLVLVAVLVLGGVCAVFPVLAAVLVRVLPILHPLGGPRLGVGRLQLGVAAGQTDDKSH
jgi:hypothetical protein